MRRRRWLYLEIGMLASVCALAACEPRLPHAIVRIEDPDEVARNGVALRLRIGTSEGASARLLGRAFPLTWTLALEGDEEEDRRVRVEVVAEGGDAIAAGEADVPFRRRAPRTITIAVGPPCDVDADCDDHLRCNGLERCDASRCIRGPEPCGPSTHACVAVSCVESEPECHIEIDHAVCAARFQGIDTYCSASEGCVRGRACIDAASCDDGFACNGFERCEDGHCIAEALLNVEDGNDCTIDACTRDSGVTHFPDPDALAHPCRLIPTATAAAGVCDARGTCVVSTCGDGVRDPRTEACGEDDPFEDFQNPNDGCERCRPTTWRPRVVAGIDPRARSPVSGAVDPSVVAVDAFGILFVVDEGDSILRVEPDAGRVSRLVTADQLREGETAPRISGLAVGPRGQLFIANAASGTLSRFDTTTGVLERIAGIGVTRDLPSSTPDRTPALETMLYRPSDVAVAPDGQVYFSEPYAHRVRTIVNGTVTTVGPVVDFEPTALAVEGGAVYVASGAEVARLSPLERHPYGLVPGPSRLFVRNGRAWVSDPQQGLIHEVDLATGTVRVFAGSLTSTRTEDGQVASNTRLAMPFGIAGTASGDVFVTELGARLLRRIDAKSRRITTLVGRRGSNEAYDDGGLAMAADLGPADGSSLAPPESPSLASLPLGVVVDARGDVYFANPGRGRIRKVDATTGVISTVVADRPGVATLALDAAGRLLFMDAAASRLEWISSTKPGRPELVAGLGAEVDDGRIAPAFALSGRGGVAVDPSGNIMFADPAWNVVRRIDCVSGVVTTVAGRLSRSGGGFSGDGGPAVSAMLAAPEAIAFDARGDLYIADTGNHRVRRVRDARIETVAGNGLEGGAGDGGAALDASIERPSALALSRDGRLFVASRSDRRIRGIDLRSLEIETAVGTGVRGGAGDGGPAALAQLGEVRGLAVDSSGNLYASETGPRTRIRRIDARTGVVTTLAGHVRPGDGRLDRGDLRGGIALAASPEPGVLWVTTGQSGRLREVSFQNDALVTRVGYPDGTPLPSGEAAFAARLGNAAGLAVDTEHRIAYLSDAAEHVILRVDASSTPWQVFRWLGTSGRAGFRDGSADEVRFDRPSGLALDAARGLLFIADSGNHVIRMVPLHEAQPRVATIVGTPRGEGFAGDGARAEAALLSAPAAVVRAKDGSLYIADTGNSRVRRVDPSGIITTVIGDGSPVSAGEGRPAMRFPIDEPRSLALDAFGNLFVATPSSIRVIAAGRDGLVTGDDEVRSIYGSRTAPRLGSATRCLTGLLFDPHAEAASGRLFLLDACDGNLVLLSREASSSP